MRCNNCGWDNASGKLRCEKCNYPLDGSLNLYEKKQPDDLSEAAQETVRGRKSEQTPWDVSRLEPGMNKEKMDSSGKSQSQSDDVLGHFHPLKNKVDDNAKSATSIKSNDSQTINPFLKKAIPKQEAGPIIKIKRIDQTTGQSTIIAEVESENGRLVINRTLINDSNPTISQNEHANLYFVEGKCFVKNLNPHGATFLRIGDLTEVKKGDCLLVGNELIVVDWDEG